MNPFKDCFAHLGKDALYQKPIRVLIKQPDLAYDIGDSKMIAEIALIEILTEDIESPSINDQLIIDNTVYRITSEPLQDASKSIWKITAIKKPCEH